MKKLAIPAVAGLLILGAAGCREDRTDSAAREAGRAAHRVAKETEKAAREADKKLKEAAREAHEGWKEAAREDREKRRP